ncbi:hypothetical protein [Bacillus pseudomycoides]|uniref:hypothetical protein n=1 Tax=Bacillus pseudomycoides TaxID=64104 RepID=UPI001FB535B7|nr:hypothetical protein [Bacillus pseudomycoides]
MKKLLLGFIMITLLVGINDQVSAAATMIDYEEVKLPSDLEYTMCRTSGYVTVPLGARLGLYINSYSDANVSWYLKDSNGNLHDNGVLWNNSQIVNKRRDIPAGKFYLQICQNERANGGSGIGKISVWK